MTSGLASVGRPLTHELLDAVPPVSALKERLSIAVVALAAATAGLTITEWAMDYDGYDVTLASLHDYSPHALGPKIDLQMKCTGQQRALKDDHVAWQLDARTSNLLAAPNRHTMSLFAVVVVPERPGHWLTWLDEGILAYCQAYFVRGSDIPLVPGGQESQVVHLPYANLLTAPALLQLMEEAARWRAEA